MTDPGWTDNAPVGDGSVTSDAGVTTTPGVAASPVPNPGGNYAAMGLTGGGSLFGAYSQLQAGKFNSRAANFNANYQRMLASQSIQAGESQVNNRVLQQRLAVGRTNAGAGGGGVVVGGGSAGAAVATQNALANEDVQNIRINAARRAYGYDVGAVDQMRRASEAAATAKQQAIGTLIGGASEEELESDPRYAGFRRSGVSFGGG